MEGTYPISNISKWGGVVILGKASNNLKVAINGPVDYAGKLAVGDGLGQIEGFNTNIPQDRFGVLTAGTVAGETVGTFDDNDNSGIMKYVSIRHSGAILSVGSEINGLTLGSVGRGTTLEHIEIVSCGDDNIEFFGGTVNVKYITSLFGNDDMLDWDLGWSGKAQFIFGMKSDLTSSVDADNGFEMDNDDQKSYNTPYAQPVIYNATMIGNAKNYKSSDNSGIAAIQAKEFTKGEIHNSVFANFNIGMNLVKVMTSGRTLAQGGNTWHNWSNNPAAPATATTTTGNGTQSLKVICNTFVGCTYPLVTDVAFNAAVGGVTSTQTVNFSSATNITSGADWDQFTVTDKNDVVASVTGFDPTFTVNTTTNAFTAKNDVTPNPALSISGCPVAPFDGFFEPANYRGAFSSVNGQNWLSNWTYSQVLNSTKGVRACATDLNLDGTTDVNDFLIFAPAFGTSCN
jgi:hypothetical protein